MDFYNVSELKGQESDHQLLEQTMDLNVGSKEYRDYLRNQFFNLDKLSNKNCIVVAEEDRVDGWCLRGDLFEHGAAQH